MIIESIKSYMEGLDSIKTFNKAINVNYLAEETSNFSIEEIPNTPIIKRYTNGSTIRQFSFAFCSREIYSQEILQNIENSNFYEELSNEIETKVNNGLLPILGNGLECLDLELTSSAYIMANEENTSIYQINLNLKYFKE